MTLTHIPRLHRYPNPPILAAMRIGVFDSGLGGLLMMSAMRGVLPTYDYLYLGDTRRLPYGNRSHDVVYDFTRRSVEFLFQQGCGLVILACNTASARALRRVQQEWLPQHYPDRRVLGVIIPTAEVAVATGKTGPIGILATHGTIRSQTFAAEITKLDPKAQILQQPTPLLVPLIEYEGERWVPEVLENYLRPLLDRGIDRLILGCTHYSLIRSQVKDVVGEDVDVLCETDIIPAKLADYLERHPEIEETLSKKGQARFTVTDITQNYKDTAARLYGMPIDFELVDI